MNHNIECVVRIACCFKRRSDLALKKFLRDDRENAIKDIICPVKPCDITGFFKSPVSPIGPNPRCVVLMEMPHGESSRKIREDFFISEKGG